MCLCFLTTPSEVPGRVPLDRVMALVIDLDTDEDASIQLQRDLLRNDSPTSVIVTTNQRQGVGAVESLGLGAIALLPRPWMPELMTQYLKFAELQFREQHRLRRKLDTLSRIHSKLTERQRDVLDLASTGMPNKGIALQLGVSQRTVESERSRLVESFGAECVSTAMINVGEYRVLEQVERIRKRGVLQRLGVNSALSKEALNLAGST